MPRRVPSLPIEVGRKNLAKRSMKSIGVRLIEARDLTDRVKWFNDPGLYENMPLEYPVSLGGTQAWYSRVVSDVSRKDFVFVRLNDKGEELELVAMGGLVSIDHRHRRSELYVAVNPRLTGQGIGHSAVQWMCNHAFHTIGLYRVFLYTIADNDGAARFYQRQGFVKEGVLRSHQIHMGRFVDRYVFGILRDEWEGKNRVNGGFDVVELLS